MKPMAARSYTDAEVEEILRRAIEREQAEADGLGHEELLAAAREIGLPDAALDRAIAEVELERSRLALVDEVRSRKRDGFLRSLITYLAVGGGFSALHLLGLLGTWVFWPVVVWGAFLLFFAPRAFRAPTEDELEKAARRRNRRERRRAIAEERERARAEKRDRRRGVSVPPRARSPVEAEIERVVEEGVSLLLRAAADKLRDASRPTAAQGDFGRYVARREGKEKGAAPIPIQVRVTAPEKSPASEGATEEATRQPSRDRARRDQ